MLTQQEEVPLRKRRALVGAGGLPKKEPEPVGATVARSLRPQSSLEKIAEKSSALLGKTAPAETVSLLKKVSPHENSTMLMDHFFGDERPVHKGSSTSGFVRALTRQLSGASVSLGNPCSMYESYAWVNAARAFSRSARRSIAPWVTAKGSAG